MNLDRAYTNEAAHIAHLERLLGARVHRIVVRKVDLVQDTTSVEVRYELPSAKTLAVDAAATSSLVGATR